MSYSSMRFFRLSSSISVSGSSCSCYGNSRWRWSICKELNASQLYIAIGKLSGIELDALTFAFSIIRKDTLLHAAQLNVEIINGTAVCNKCLQEFECNEFGKACPFCQSYSVRITGGKDMKVQRISIDDKL